jgi:hypothetical protein
MARNRATRSRVGPRVHRAGRNALLRASADGAAALRIVSAGLVVALGVAFVCTGASSDGEPASPTTSSLRGHRVRGHPLRRMRRWRTVERDSWAAMRSVTRQPPSPLAARRPSVSTSQRLGLRARTSAGRRFPARRRRQTRSRADPRRVSRAHDVTRLLGRALRWAARSKPSFSARRVRLGVDEPRPAGPRPPRGRRAVGEPGAAGRAPAGPRRD